MVPESEQEVLLGRRNRTGKIVIEGGTVNASSWSGAGIGSGYGHAPGNPAIIAEIEIHGGMITAYSEDGSLHRKW